MNTKRKTIHDADLVKVEPALRRAAERARKIAEETRTPLVIYKDGRVVRQVVEEKIIRYSK